MVKLTRRIACCILFFISTNTTKAQDSLELATTNKKLSTTERLNAYTALIDKWVLAKTSQALEKINEATLLAKEANDSLILAKLLFQRGVALNQQGKKDSTSLYYFEAAGIFERHNADKELANVYNNIGRLFRKTDFEKALFYYDRALAIFKKEKDEDGEATILNESGVAFEYAEKFEEAIKRYQASLAIQKKTNNKVGMGYALEFLSGAYLKRKEYSKSEDYLLQALAIRKEVNDTFALAINYTNLGEFYKATDKKQMALEQFLKSNELATTINFLDLISYNYKELADIKQEMGDAKNALAYFQQHIAIKDSLYDIEKTKQLNELSTQYETEKNKATIEKQQYAINRRNILIGAFALLLIAGLFIAYTLNKKNKAEHDLKLQAAIVEQQDKATQAILNAEENERQRIARDLHDGIGQVLSAAKMNLSAYYSAAKNMDDIQKNDLEKAIYLVDESCKEIRVVSHNMMPNALIKNSLAAAVRDFIDKLDKKALQVHLYTEGLDTRIDVKVESVLYRVIQECVNNVIKHSKADKLDISVIRDKDGISTTIEDNGVGFNAADKNKFEGIGLKNITNRVSYLNGTVDFDSSEGNGTLVAIHIPLH